jgi:hypothetical protein
MALGYLALRVDVKYPKLLSIYYSKLHEIIERNILSSLVGFLDKPQD